jgi:hypothetical protein
MWSQNDPSRSPGAFYRPNDLHRKLADGAYLYRAKKNQEFVSLLFKSVVTGLDYRYLATGPVG